MDRLGPRFPQALPRGWLGSKPISAACPDQRPGRSVAHALAASDDAFAPFPYLRAGKFRLRCQPKTGRGEAPHLILRTDTRFGLKRRHNGCSLKWVRSALRPKGPGPSEGRVFWSKGKAKQ
jgi:hypothetical protein